MAAVYFDNNATTPLDPRVREVMLTWLGEHHGNPSSIHRFGQEARDAVEEARLQVAGLLGALPREVVFESSGTEANNAILWDRARSQGFAGHFVISTLEHPSIRVLSESLETLGIRTSLVAPGTDGVVSADAVLEALTPETTLVCLLSASNEIGTLQPVAEVSAICRERRIWMHCDAVQSAGKVPVNVHELGADSVVLGAHKFHGPLGAAALWVREGAEFSGGLLGGSQERGRRASTENVAAVAGFGEACRLAREELEDRTVYLARLRDRLERGIDLLPDVVVHCRSAARLPHTSHIAVLGVEGEALLIRLDLAGYAVSTGSACASGVVEPSQALLSMGVSAEEALASLRISLGMTNTMAEVDDFLSVLEREISSLRAVAPSLLA